MRKILFYNKFIICLYMFRALLCSSSGGENCIMQHLLSSHSVGGRPVLSQHAHRKASYTVWRYQMLYNTILTPWWRAQQCSKHVEAYNKTYYKTRICVLNWSITEIRLIYKLYNLYLQGPISAIYEYMDTAKTVGVIYINSASVLGVIVAYIDRRSVVCTV